MALTGIVLAALVVCGGYAQQIPNQRQRQSAIQGRVTDDGGRGVPGAVVALQSGTREVARTMAMAYVGRVFFDQP